MAGTSTSTASVLRPRRRLGEADEALPVPCPVAVEHLVDLGSAGEEVDIVVPGEADTAVQLQRLTADVGKGVVDVGPGGGDGRGRVVEPVTEGKRGIVGGRPHGFELHEQVGEPMLDRLEAGDGAAELHALLRVVDGL